ncbi:MAG: hypothetical protein R3B06_17125 [Kofleriaceae bacterium]
MTDDDAPLGPEPPTDPRPTGLRVKDVLNRSAEELEELEAALDPSARAELEAWFSGASANARPAPAPVEEPVDEFSAALDAAYEVRQARIAVACTAIEPSMIELLERHARHKLPLLTLMPPPPLYDETILSLRVPTDEEMSTIAAPRSYEREDAVEAAVHESVPQAILRDLARVEAEFTIEYVAPPADDQVAEDARVAVREALGHRLELPPVVSVSALAREARAEFVAQISGPWAELVAAGKAWRQAWNAEP